MKQRLALVLSAFGFALLATLAPAYASTLDHGITSIGRSVTIPSDEEVTGDVTVVGGDLDVAGRVDGDVTVIGGTLTREAGSQITGDVNSLGDNVSSYVPFAPAATARVARQNHELTLWLAYSVIVVLAFLLFPIRVRTALDRVEHHPGLSAGVGVLALVAVFPIMILLLISVIGIPLIPVEVIAVFAAVLIGQAAVSMLIGRRVYELLLPRTTPSPLGALVLGLVVVCAAGMVPVLGPLVICLVWLVGLGAAILAFVRETAFMGPAAAQVPGGPMGGGPMGGPRPPIGGPPMPA